MAMTGADLANRRKFCRTYWDDQSRDWQIKNCDYKTALIAINTLMLLASFAELVLSFWSIVITCTAIRKTNGCGCCSCCQCCYDTSGTPQNVIYKPPNSQDPSIVNTGIVAPQQRPTFVKMQHGTPPYPIQQMQPQMQKGVFPPQMQQGVFQPQMQQGAPLPQMQQGGFPPQMQQGVSSSYMQQVEQVSPSCPEQPPWASDPPPYTTLYT
jgi:hypothetical protein